MEFAEDLEKLRIMIQLQLRIIHNSKMRMRE